MEARQLLANLHSDDESLRHRATLELGGCGRRHADWVDDLIDGVRGGDGEVRFWAAIALGRIGRGAAKAVPVLVDLMLTDERFGNRQVAAQALAKIAPAAAGEAIPALARVVEADEEDSCAAMPLTHWQDLAVFDTDAVPALAHALEHSDEAVREAAIAGLGRLGGRPALPAPRCGR